MDLILKSSNVFLYSLYFEKKKTKSLNVTNLSYKSNTYLHN